MNLQTAFYYLPGTRNYAKYSLWVDVLNHHYILEEGALLSFIFSR